jgi:hypothetical protein
MKSFNLWLLVMIGVSSWSGGLSGANLENPRVNGWLYSELNLPDPARDYFPFLKMEVPAPGQFLWVQAEFDIGWLTSGEPAESIKLNFEAVSLLVKGSESPIQPVGSITADGRLTTLNNPSFARIEANESWGAKNLRFGALFVVESSKDLVLRFDGIEYPVELQEGEPPTPSSFVDVSVEGVQWVSRQPSGGGNLSRRIPEATVYLDPGDRSLLSVDLVLSPLKPNVIGGENRFVFRPSDFELRAGDSRIEPLGAVNFGKFTEDTIFNISRNTLADLPEAEQRFTLVFEVPPGLKAGELRYFGEPLETISAP